MGSPCKQGVNTSWFHSIRIQMGNLIDALAQVAVTGDWYGEFCDIIAVAMQKSALTKIIVQPG